MKPKQQQNGGSEMKFLVFPNLGYASLNKAVYTKDATKWRQLTESRRAMELLSQAFDRRSS